MENQPFGVVLRPQFDTETIKIGRPVLLSKDSLTLNRVSYAFDTVLKNLEIKTYGLISKVGPLTLDVCCLDSDGNSGYVKIPVKYVADSVIILVML